MQTHKPFASQSSLHFSVKSDKMDKKEGTHMARSDDQKRKLLYLRELLEQQSDENHPLSTQYILEYLAERGIQAERKSTKFC